MTYAFFPDNAGSITLEEYVEYIKGSVDPEDPESVAASAGKLKELGNNRTFVGELLNQQLKGGPDRLCFYSAQSAVLAATADFTVRLNVWPAASQDPRKRAHEGRVYSYYDVHDHNFSFMTVGYHGPGYGTRLYEIDPEDIVGYVGEPVDIRFVEETSLPVGKVMLYRAFRDAHMQIPPPSFSMSLNLMINDPYSGLVQQHYYDVERNVICDYVESLSSKRVSVVECLRFVGNENSKDILEHLSKTHPCVRTRWASYETLATMIPERAEHYWAAARRDRDPLLKIAAKSRLRASNR